jgi:hypothetical protein
MLIGTYQKIGVGFDDDTFNVIILLDNVANVIQSEGRIRINNFLLIDIVDNHDCFLPHWRLRKYWYTGRGATFLQVLRC